MLKGKRKIMMLFAFSAGTTLFVILLLAFGYLNSLENSTVDRRFAIRGQLATSYYKDVRLVAVNDKTFADLKMRWPFRRTVQAQMIDKLKAAGAKVIVEDIQYTEPSEDPNDDYALADSIANAGNVVLATTETDHGKTDVMGGDENVKAMGATVGNARFPFDPGAVIRKMNRTRDGIFSLPVAAYARFAGRAPPVSDFKNNFAWINYVGRSATVPTYAYSDVLRGRFAKNSFKGKIVVVGATDPTLQDIHRTSSTQAMSGPEIHANAIATIINTFPMTAASGFLVVLLILMFGFADPLLNLRFDPMGAFLTCLGAGIFYVLAAIYIFNLGFILPIAYPLIALALSMVATLGINFLSAAFEKERVRNEFARFAPDSVVEQVLDEAGDGNKLGGKRLVATLLFSDLRGFTTFSEKLEPEQVINTLNDYLTEMSEAILNHHGTLVSFMGDGIMAVFGAPIANDVHADQALGAARDMLDRMEDFNARMVEQGLGKGFKMGIGLNTGEVMSGNVGSERRLEYTAIGDTTNTAARLEGATKGTKYQLYISSATRDALSEVPADFEFVEDMPIRGREGTLGVWGLISADVSDLDPAQATPAAAPDEPTWSPTS
jgi:adenylate cyclase